MQLLWEGAVFKMLNEKHMQMWYPSHPNDWIRSATSHMGGQQQQNITHDIGMTCGITCSYGFDKKVSGALWLSQTPVKNDVLLIGKTEDCQRFVRGSDALSTFFPHKKPASTTFSNRIIWQRYKRGSNRIEHKRRRARFRLKSKYNIRTLHITMVTIGLHHGE